MKNDLIRDIKLDFNTRKSGGKKVVGSIKAQPGRNKSL